MFKQLYELSKGGDMRDVKDFLEKHSTLTDGCNTPSIRHEPFEIINTSTTKLVKTYD